MPASMIQKLEARLEVVVTNVQKIGKLEKELQKVNRQLDKVTAAGQRTAVATEKTARSIDFLGMSLVRAAAKIGSVMLIGHAFGMIAKAMFKPIGMAAEFEQAMAHVSKTTEITGEALRNLGHNILTMSASIPMAHDELAKIAQVAGQLGIKGSQNILDFTNTVARMAFTLEMTTEEAAAGIARLDNIFKEVDKTIDTSAGHYEHMANVINYLSNNTTATGRDLVDFGQRVGGVASLAGITSEEIFGLGAALKDLGFKNEVAASAFIRFTTAMITKGRELGEAVGIMSKEYEDALAKDMPKAIQMFLTELGKLDKQQQLSILGMKGLRLSGVRTAPVILKLAQAIELVGGHMDMATKDASRFGSMLREFEKVTDTTLSTWQMFKNALSGSIKIGFEDANTWVKRFLQSVLEGAKGNEMYRQSSENLAQSIADLAIPFELLQDIFVLTKEQGGKLGGTFKEEAKSADELTAALRKGERGSINYTKALDKLIEKNLVNTKSLRDYYELVDTVGINSWQASVARIDLVNESIGNMSKRLEDSKASWYAQQAGISDVSVLMEEYKFESEGAAQSTSLLAHATRDLTAAQREALHSFDDLLVKMEQMSKTAEEKTADKIAEMYIDMEQKLKEAGVEFGSAAWVESMNKVRELGRKIMGKFTKDTTTNLTKQQKAHEKYAEKVKKLYMDEFEYKTYLYNKDIDEFHKHNEKMKLNAEQTATALRAIYEKHFGEATVMPQIEGAFEGIVDLDALEAEFDRMKDIYEGNYDKLHELTQEYSERKQEILDELFSYEEGIATEALEIQADLITAQMESYEMLYKMGLMSKEDFVQRSIELDAQMLQNSIESKMAELAQWGPMTEEQMRIYSEMAEYVMQLQDAIARGDWEAVQEIINHWRNAKTEILGIWDDFAKGMGNVFANVISRAIGSGDMRDFGEAMFSGIGSQLGKALEGAFKPLVDGIGGVFGSFLSGLLPGMSGILSQFMSQMWSWLSSYLQQQAENDREQRILEELREKFYDAAAGSSEALENFLRTMEYHATRGDPASEDAVARMMKEMEAIWNQYFQAALEGDAEAIGWIEFLVGLMEDALAQGGLSAEVENFYQGLLDQYTGTTDAITQGTGEYFDNIKSEKEKFFQKINAENKKIADGIVAVQNRFILRTVESIDYLDKTVGDAIEKIVSTETEYLDLLAGETLRAMGILTDEMTEAIDLMAGTLIDRINDIEWPEFGPGMGGGGLVPDALYSLFGGGFPFEDVFSMPAGSPPAPPPGMTPPPSHKAGSSISKVVNVNIASNYAEDLPGSVGDALNRFIDEKGEIKFSLAGGNLINLSTSDDLRGVSL